MLSNLWFQFQQDWSALPKSQTDRQTDRGQTALTLQNFVQFLGYFTSGYSHQ